MQTRPLKQDFSSLLDRAIRKEGLDPEALYRESSGLRPSLFWVMGPGLNREELKHAFLGRGLGLVGSAIRNLEGFALDLLKALPRAEDPPSGYRIAQGSFRQEVLRFLLSQSSISKWVPELERLSHQGPFLKRLDRALQSGRLSYTSDPELEAMDQQLQERFQGAVNPLRRELMILTTAYETWLKTHSFLDPVLVYREGLSRLEEAQVEGVESIADFPARIVLLTASELEPLQKSWVTALGHWVDIQLISVLNPTGSEPKKHHVAWKRAHTLDDAAAYLGDRLLEGVQAEGSSFLSETAVLIPDQPEVRRSLLRALNAKGLPLEDPRDPTLIRSEESLKRALLPLEVVGSRFERERVLGYISAFGSRLAFPIHEWTKEIYRRGVSQGLASYQGGKLQPLFEHLNALQTRWGVRLNASEWAKEYPQWLRSLLAPEEWVWIPFLESQWAHFAEDLRPFEKERGGVPIRFPLLLALERFRLRLQEATPPADGRVLRGGVKLYRLSQLSLHSARRVFFFGMPGDWLQGESVTGAGDYFFSRREREVLSADYPLRSTEGVRRERRFVLDRWIEAASEIEIWDAHYDWDGSERAESSLLLQELGLSLTSEISTFCERDLGAHPRWRAGYSSRRLSVPSAVRIVSDAFTRDPETQLPFITASQLESQSRCGFVGLAQGRWRLEDLKAPSTALWPEERGRILHEAVKVCVEHRDPSGAFLISAQEALEQAWKKISPRGLLPARRFRAMAERSMLRVLESFMEVEREWYVRVKAEPIALDQEELRLRGENYIIRGRPDRVDRWKDHLLVLDYKTSAVNPTGNRILEVGTRLQLPFYGLAARERWGAEVLGAQFVVLNRDHDRSRGLFFEAGVDSSSSRKKNPEPQQEAEKPFRLSSRNNSILRIDLHEGWSVLRSWVDRTAQSYITGSHDPVPRDPSECEHCRFAVLCGFDRAGGPPAAAKKGDTVPLVEE
jgi:hypothetical protein